MEELRLAAKKMDVSSTLSKRQKIHLASEKPKNLDKMAKSEKLHKSYMVKQPQQSPPLVVHSASLKLNSKNVDIIIDIV